MAWSSGSAEPFDASVLVSDSLWPRLWQEIQAAGGAPWPNGSEEDTRVVIAAILYCTLTSGTWSTAPTCSVPMSRVKAVYRHWQSTGLLGRLTRILQIDLRIDPT